MMIPQNYDVSYRATSDDWISRAVQAARCAALYLMGPNCMQPFK